MLPPTKKLPLIANIGIDLQPQADGQKEWILNLKKCFEIVLRFVPFLFKFLKSLLLVKISHSPFWVCQIGVEMDRSDITSISCPIISLQSWN
jgi:hypothetical protein